MGVPRRHLFLDDRAIQQLVNVRQAFHQPVKAGPVILGDKPWDQGSIQIRSGPSWDPEKKRWMLWYLLPGGSGLATSTDGVRWEKPIVGGRVHSGTRQNNMLPENLYSIFYDAQESNPQRRYKGFLWVQSKSKPATLKWTRTLPSRTHGLFPAVSADGVNWRLLEAGFIQSHDEFHLFYDTERKIYVATVKQNANYGRSVHLAMSRDFEHWTDSRDCLIFHADKFDQETGARVVLEHLNNRELQQPRFNRPEEYETDIYALPVFLYEGLYIGIPTVFHHSGNTSDNADGFSTTELIFSRDLLHWTRVFQGSKFIPLSPVAGGRNFDLAQILAANYPVVTEKELLIYYTGIQTRTAPPNTVEASAVCLARLRRDGFVSLDAGAEEGIVTTQPVDVTGPSLHVNVTGAKGELRVEVLEAGTDQVAPGFSAGESIAFRGDEVDVSLQWTHRPSLASIVGKTVRLRFRMRNASLYSFWFSK